MTTDTPASREQQALAWPPTEQQLNDWLADIVEAWWSASSAAYIRAGKLQATDIRAKYVLRDLLKPWAEVAFRDAPHPESASGEERRYLADRFEWAAPGDQQEDAWIVRFCDNDIRDAIYTGPDAEQEAWAAWERHSPGYNMYLFRLARLAAPHPTQVTETREAIEKAVLVCPVCEGEGSYADGVDEAACSETCHRCAGNGWIANADAILAALSQHAIDTQKALPLAFYDSSDPARRIANLAAAFEAGSGRVSVVGWRQLIADLNAALSQHDGEGCRVCGKPIVSAELCGECAKGNDPFFTSKYSEGRP